MINLQLLYYKYIITLNYILHMLKYLPYWVNTNIKKLYGIQVVFRSLSLGQVRYNLKLEYTYITHRFFY